MRMRCLSIRQPYAWLVLYGRKNIENRKWRTNFRGEFFIHAAKTMTSVDYSRAVNFARHVSPLVVVPPEHELPRGGIVGSARLVDVIPPCVGKVCQHPWHIPEQYGFVLVDVNPLPFCPLAGSLNFFDPRKFGFDFDAMFPRKA